MGVTMPGKKAEEVGSAEEYLMPWESGGESAEDAGQSLFDAMESSDLDVDDLDHPEGEGEPPAADPAVSERDEEDEPEPEDLDDEEDLEDDEEFDEDYEDDAEDDEEQDEATSQALSDDTRIPDVPLPGGETTELTLAELKAGYSRTADYTRKRQRDASEHASAMESLRAAREKYDAGLAKVRETLESAGPAKPDQELKRTNPGLYAAQVLEYREFQENLDKVDTARGGVDQERQQELLEIRGQIVAQEKQKLFDAVPEWGADEGVAQTELAQLAQFAVSAYGFTQEQLDTVVDHRLLLMLRENKQARDRLAKGKKTLEGKKKSAPRLQPGSRKAGRRGSASDRARKQMAQKGGGSLRDHARLLELDLGDDLL